MVLFVETVEHDQVGAVAVDEGIEAQPTLPGAGEVRYGNISKFKDYWIN